jgi:hypothetical protein
VSLRREVYLEAAGAASHLSQVLGRVVLPGSDLNTLTKDFADDLAKLAKV